MESLNQDGIKYADLDTETLVARIADVEQLKRDQNEELRHLDPTMRGMEFMNRPLIIWQLFQKHFGSEYFLEVIEEEYGIAPGANELIAAKISQHFDRYIQLYKQE